MTHSVFKAADTGNKTAAGYVTSLLDKFGIITGYNFVGAPPDGGNGLLWSQITSQSSFQSFAAPYPIITITNADVEAGKCEPETGSAIWEISPDEFGSWDDTVHAFFPTEYMGTPGDRVMSTTTCTAGFDNVGFVTATSSNILVVSLIFSVRAPIFSRINALEIDASLHRTRRTAPQAITQTRTSHSLIKR